MSKVSIILPVYNVEKYLSCCLDSILNQTFKDFECICVNDGSTDNSLKILQSYKEKDSRIKIISQNNKGLSVARNVGINICSSPYITFVDSDDWLTINYLERLYNEIEKTKADIVRASYQFYWQEQNVFVHAKIRKIYKIYNIKDDYERFVKGYIGALAWGKLYKTKLIKDNNIYFYEKRSAEDNPFCALTFLYSRKICFITDEIYFYRKHCDTISRNNEKMIVDNFHNFIRLTKELKERKKLNNKKIINYLVNQFIYKISSLSKIKIVDKELVYISIEHLNFCFNNLSGITLYSKIKIYIAIRLIKIFREKSFKIFRIFKFLVN